MARAAARKSPVRSSSRRSRQTMEDLAATDYSRPLVRKAALAPLEAQTDMQAVYMNAIEHYDLIFGTGPAGVGKTYICGAMAADALKSKRVDTLIITRPAVDAGESLGFLPGEIEDKYAPYIAPFMAVLTERLGKAEVEYMLKQDRIRAEPLAYMRGHTFKDAFVIMDEAQNATPKQMKLFLTRVGENSTVIVNGDISQKDIPGPSGLVDAIKRTKKIKKVVTVAFTKADIVRSGLCQEIVEAYETTAE